MIEKKSLDYEKTILFGIVVETKKNNLITLNVRKISAKTHIYDF